MIVFPNAKINLGLRVLRKRADGFHDIETIFYPVTLCDALEILPSHTTESSFRCTGLSPEIVSGQNLVLKAYELLKTHFPEIPPVDIFLHKAIPAGAGLGGGSADASFTLQLLCRQFRLPATDELLQQLALTLGSDCPFFLYNKPSLGTGRGEQLQPVSPDLKNHAWVLVNPRIHVSTAAAFAAITPQVPAESLQELIHLPPAQWQGRVINDFEIPVFALHPEIAAIKETLLSAGAVFAAMSGTGSTVFGLFEQKEPQLPAFPDHYFVRSGR
ncbi:MAG: 4-(cytidine 5'-diphospho)-2-C-methyl-D-erythritol kinase [Chitinophagaceae bacterium]